MTERAFGGAPTAAAEGCAVASIASSNSLTTTEGGNSALLVMLCPT